MFGIRWAVILKYVSSSSDSSKAWNSRVYHAPKVCSRRLLYEIPAQHPLPLEREFFFISADSRSWYSGLLKFSSYPNEKHWLVSSRGERVQRGVKYETNACVIA